MIRARARLFVTPQRNASLFMLASPSLGTLAGDVHASNHETISRFSSDPGEFFRIGYDADRLYLPLLDFNAQNKERLSANADDQRGLAVDLGHLRLRARRRHKVLASAHAKACHRFTPSQ